MAIQVIDAGQLPDVWTQFYDMHSGGSEKTDYAQVYIQAPEEEAIAIFKERFGQDPRDTYCECCGPNFAIYEAETLAEATAFERNVEIEDGVEYWAHYGRPYIPRDDETTPGQWAYRWGLTEYCLRPDVLVIQTREV